MESDRKTLQIEVVTENADQSGVYFTVLDLPAMGGRIWDALQRLRSTATPERPFDVSIRESPKLPELAGVTLTTPTLPELNFFARRLASMPDEDVLLLKGVFRHRMETGRYENGIPMKELIIHPRLQKEGYKGTPHLEAFAEAVEALQCPLCYNGDITSPESLTQILTKLPSIDTVMIGRGILQNPGLLQELKAASTESVALPSCEERLAVLKEFHTSLLTGYQEIMSGDTNTLYKMKDLWTFLSHSFESPDKYVKKIRKATDASDYKLAVNALFRECALKSENS